MTPDRTTITPLAHFIWYGQSEWQGWQAAPPLVATQQHDCLMFGHAPRPMVVAREAPGVRRFDPVGGPGFAPLVSVCQEVETGKLTTPARGGLSNIRNAAVSMAPLTIDLAAATYVLHGGEAETPQGDLATVFRPGQKIVFHAAGGDWAEQRLHGVTAVAARRLTLGGPPPEGLPEGFEIHIVNSQIELLGEEPGVAALTHLRGLQRAARTHAPPPLLTNCCIGGTAIAWLSKGSPAGLYHRVPDAVARVHAASGGGSAVAAVVFGQGGTDCQRRTHRAAYAARLETLLADLAADILAITGQENPPRFLTFQVSGPNLAGDDRCAVPMAQLAAALAPRRGGWTMIGPFYAVPDQKIPFGGVHWTGNGARWAGQITGKVLHKVLDLGETWLPLHPTRLIRDGRELLIDFHVPEPPLQFRPVFCGTTPVEWPDRGFEVSDRTGAVEISAVTIVGQNRLRVTCARAPGAGALVHYGGVKTRGGGNLCDSDPALASETYRYDRFAGQSPAEDVAGLVGLAYPLWNWCVLFKLPVGYQGTGAPV